MVSPTARCEAPWVFDALAHLHLLPSEAVGPALAHAHAAGVTDILTATERPGDPSLKAPAAGPRLHRALGLHPACVPTDPAARSTALAELAQLVAAGGVVAIGECGLDLRPGKPPKDAQQHALKAQLKIMVDNDLPGVFHVVQATEAFFEALGQAPGPVRGVWHAFSGSAEVAARAATLGLSLSVGGLVKNPHARRLQAAIPHIPADRLLAETDAPELPLSALADVVAAIAQRLGEEPAAVAARTAQNARALFLG
jgi:TatD DNase family protein